MISWLKNIGDYFRFVNNRRIDTRYRVIPSIPKAIVGFAAFSAVLILLFIYIDPILLEWIRSPGRSYPLIFESITKFGKVNWFLAVTGIILIILSVLNARRFKGHKNLVWHRIFLNVYFVFTSVAYSGLIVMLLKNVIGRARPLYTPLADTWFSMPFEGRYQFASFPSGHSTTAGAVAIALSILFPRLRWFFIPAGILVAISRPVLGVHYSTDIVAGFCLGAVFVLVYARFFAQKRLLFKFGERGKLELRGEGKGKMHLLFPMVKSALISNSNQKSSSLAK